MDKTEILERYAKPEDKLLVSKMLDKIEFCIKRNVITNTDFLDLYQRNILEKVLKIVNCNYIFFGGYDDASRVMLIIYPDKLTLDMVRKNIFKLMEIVRINLPKSLYGKYIHKDYLSGIMKLGIKREKFGDILVGEDGADIIANTDMSNYIKENLIQLTRFAKSKTEILGINDIKKIETKKEELKIVIQSLRLDSIVAQLANTSRTKASEIIEQGRVFVNYENALKIDKQINEKDIIVVRGKGKFEIDKIEGNTRKNKLIIIVKKYI